MAVETPGLPSEKHSGWFIPESVRDCGEFRGAETARFVWRSDAAEICRASAQTPPRLCAMITAGGPMGEPASCTCYVDVTVLLCARCYWYIEVYATI